MARGKPPSLCLYFADPIGAVVGGPSIGENNVLDYLADPAHVGALHTLTIRRWTVDKTRVMDYHQNNRAVPPSSADTPKHVIQLAGYSHQ